MPEPIRPNLFGTTHKITSISPDGSINEIEITGPIVVENKKPSEELLNKLLEQTLSYISVEENLCPEKHLDIELPFINSGGDSLSSILRISVIKKGYRTSPDSNPYDSDKNTLFLFLIRDNAEDFCRETTNGMFFKFGDVLSDPDKTEIKEYIRLAISGADELTRRASARQGLNQVSRSIFDANSSNSSENN